MLEPDLFDSVILSRRRRNRLPALRRGAAITLALTLHAAVLAALLLAPFLALEMMSAPKAGVENIHILRPLNPGAHGGDGLPAASIRHGQRNAGLQARAAAPAATPPRIRQPERVPLEPPEAGATPAPPETGRTDGDAGNGPGQSGDPSGRGDSDIGVPDGCPGCIGSGPDLGPAGPGSDDDAAYAWTPGVTPPELIPGTRALPKYPDLARRARIEGSVILMIRIDQEGRVGEVEVLRSPDQRWGFDLAAIEAVKQWRYRPASMHGRDVSVYAQVIVEFSLSR